MDTFLRRWSSLLTVISFCIAGNKWQASSEQLHMYKNLLIYKEHTELQTIAPLEDRRPFDQLFALTARYNLGSLDSQ